MIPGGGIVKNKSTMPTMSFFCLMAELIKENLYGSAIKQKTHAKAWALLIFSCGEGGKETLLPNNSLSISYNP